MMMKPLILASASPRRAAILRQIGIDFKQVASQVEETDSGSFDPAGQAQALARIKALAVAQQQKEQWILGADTMVVIGQTILGKPRDEADAARMLRMLAGNEHTVFTGLALLRSGKDRDVIQVEKTRIWMRHLEEDEINGYISTKEPLGKAGAYAIQGLGAALIDRLDGCYYNVVGLPVVRLINMLKEVGFPFRFQNPMDRTPL